MKDIGIDMDKKVMCHSGHQIARHLSVEFEVRGARASVKGCHRRSTRNSDFTPIEASTAAEVLLLCFGSDPIK